MDSNELMELCNQVLHKNVFKRDRGELIGIKDEELLALALKSRLEKEQTHVLVPREPTRQMMEEFYGEQLTDDQFDAGSEYHKAMLSSIKEG